MQCKNERIKKFSVLPGLLRKWRTTPDMDEEKSKAVACQLTSLLKITAECLFVGGGGGSGGIDIATDRLTIDTRHIRSVIVIDQNSDTH